MGATCCCCCTRCDCCEDLRLRHCALDNCPKFIPEVSRAKVVKVYDGDTITVAARLRRKGKPYLFRVRLARIDSPEMRGNDKAAAILARDALANELLGKYVSLTEARRLFIPAAPPSSHRHGPRQVRTEKYGRVLATVRYRGRDMCQWMLENGHALPYDGGTKPSWSASPSGATGVTGAHVTEPSPGPPASTPLSRRATPPSGRANRQDPALVARVCELGAAGTPVTEIDRTLHRELFATSTGTPWPARNDGRVVVRLLVNNGITPVGGDARVDAFIADYTDAHSRRRVCADGARREVAPPLGAIAAV